MITSLKEEKYSREGFIHETFRSKMEDSYELFREF